MFYVKHSTTPSYNRRQPDQQGESMPEDEGTREDQLNDRVGELLQEDPSVDGPEERPGLHVQETPQPPEFRTETESVPPQPMFDDRAIAQDLMNARQALAASKLRYHASRAGIKGVQGHPNQFRDELRDTQKLIDFLEKVGREGLPEVEAGAELVIAHAIVDDGQQS